MYQVTQAVSLLPVYLPTTLSLSQLSHVFWKRREQSPSPFPDFSFALHSYRDKVFPPTYILKLLWQELPLTSVWPNPKEIFNLWNYLLIFRFTWYSWIFPLYPSTTLASYSPISLPLFLSWFGGSSSFTYTFSGIFCLIIYPLVMSSTSPVNWVLQIHILNCFFDVYPWITHR